MHIGAPRDGLAKRLSLCRRFDGSVHRPASLSLGRLTVPRLCGPCLVHPLLTPLVCPLGVLLAGFVRGPLDHDFACAVGCLQPPRSQWSPLSSVATTSGPDATVHGHRQSMAALGDWRDRA